CVADQVVDDLAGKRVLDTRLPWEQQLITVDREPAGRREMAGMARRSERAVVLVLARADGKNRPLGCDDDPALAPDGRRSGISAEIPSSQTEMKPRFAIVQPEPVAKVTAIAAVLAHARDQLDRAVIGADADVVAVDLEGLAGLDGGNVAAAEAAGAVD